MRRSNLIWGAFFTLFSLVLIGCVNTSKQKQKPIEHQKKEIELKAPSASIKTDYYQLSNIQGFFAPSGSTYEYDTKRKLWCERPTAGEMMSFANSEGVSDPNQIPDLSNYFDLKTTTLLNSGILSIQKNVDYYAINLSVGSLFIYIDTIPVGINSFKLQSLRKRLFNFDIDGDMILEDGRNYFMTLKPSPMISFENDYGTYELHFQKIKSQKIAKVRATKAYFYAENNLNSQQRMFVLKNQNVYVYEINGAFAFVSLVNSYGQVIKGWLRKIDLAL
jgi:hypothetical protein